MEGVDAVLARRDRLLEAVAAAFASGPAETALARAVDTAAVVLPRGTSHSAVYRSLAHLAGRAPPRTDLRDVCWALAADVPALRVDRPVWPPVLRDGAPALFQVVAARAAPRRPGADLRVRLRLKAVAGTGAPAETEVTWASRFLQYAAQTVFGFCRPPRRPDPNRPAPQGPRYVHYLQVVSCRFRGTPEERDGRREIGALACPPAAVQWNRALGDMRARTTCACPFAYTHPCQECRKGRDECPAACRPLTLVDDPCPGCGRVATLDKAWGGLCRTCEDPRRPAAKPKDTP